MTTPDDPLPPPSPVPAPVLPAPEPVPEEEPPLVLEAAIERSRRGRVVRRLAAALLAALVLAGAVLGVLRYTDTRDDLRRAQAASARREEALTAARGLAVTLTSYDYRRIAEDVKKVADSSAGKFRDEYAIASGPQFQQLVRTNKATSTGKVLSAGLVRDDGRQVVVLLAVDQTVTNVTRPRPSVDRNRVQLTLENQGGRWLIVDVSVL